MIVREVAVERYEFTCTRGNHTWVIDYDVQHVEDGHGHQHDYFFRNGQPSIDPNAPQAFICPTCHEAHIRVQLTARRNTPVVDITDAPNATTPSARLISERKNAAPLPTDGG